MAFYQAGDSRVHRLNPVTKLVFALVLIIAAFAVNVVWWPAVLWVVLLPAVAVSGVFRPFIARTLKYFVPFIALIFIAQGLFYPEGGPVLAHLGPLSVKENGLLFAAQTALRLLVLVDAFLFLLLTTHPGLLMSALTERGMPPNISYVVSATLQIIPTFRDRAQGILQAQRARGLETSGGGPVRRMRSLVPLVAPLVLGSLTDVEDRAVAMEARAFGAPTRRTSLAVIPDSGAQRTARWLMWAFALATLIVNALGVLG